MALQLLQQLREDQRPATPAEQETLARWSSWGALPGVFDLAAADASGRNEAARALLSADEFTAARRTTINAHYTDPRLIDAVWEGIKGLGFTGGRVLEPGSGVGGFIGLAPSGAAMVGVELDPVSAEISRHLYPSAAIRTESFADTHLPKSFDAAVGNVPFGQITLHDRRYNSGRHSIHNHFIIKSMDLVREGGIVAMLTSRYTMDAIDPAARKEMYERADLVTAIRLPTGAHLDFAGTDVVTDLLIFRVRPEGAERGDSSWLHTTPVEVPHVTGGVEAINLNAWFDLHPGLVQGEMSVGTGMYGANTLRIAPYGDGMTQTYHDFRALVELETAAAVKEGMGFTDVQQGVLELPAADYSTAPVAEAGDMRRFEGFIERDGSGGFTCLNGGVREPLEVPRAQGKPLGLLLDLRDAQLALLEAEASSDATASLDDLRAQLNTRYDAFASAHGPINTVTVSTSTRLDRNGVPIVTRRKPAVMKTFDRDPFAAAVRGLEVYDEETNTAQKASVFVERVVHRIEIPTSADTPADALAITLDLRGFVDLDTVAGLLGVPADAARTQLGDLVFTDPDSDRLVPRAEYLSGNVRAALKVAEEAALERPELMVNVEALRPVVPKDLTPAEITANLGAAWIPASDVQAFLRETLGDKRVVVEHPTGGSWGVRAGDKLSVAASSTWGTSRLNALKLAENLMEQKAIVVHDTIKNSDGGDRRVVNAVETEAAQAKAEQLGERFREWVWEDPDRARRLSGLYNDTFNAIALRDYTEDGRRLTLPGLAAWFTPHEHQRTAVARIIAEPSVGLYHGVGAGKTAEMVMGAMELRRLGLIDKPCIAVPNHMLEQVSREWMQLYPRARLLAASSEDLRGERRAQFIGRAAMGDWDAVVLTHGAFEKLPTSDATALAYISKEADEARTHLEGARAAGMSAQTVKTIEAKVMRLEERLKDRMDRPRDRGLTFEQTGIDYLMIDELHLYKNLGINSNIQDMNRDGSRRAADLDLKLSWLRGEAETRAAERGHGRARVMTGATATPIANSVAEAWVMQKYLRPDLLEAAGVASFDSWAATFGTLVTELEMTPDGGYRQKSRFARFDNLPELLRMWHVSADVKTSDQLALKIPLHTERSDGTRGPETVVIPASPELVDFMGSLAERAENLRKSSAPRGKGEDNMLVVTSDGRKAALDLRMLDRTQHEPVASTESKVDVVAEKVHGIWLASRDDVFTDPSTDFPHPTPGALQIVFADLGTPKAGGPTADWSFYVELRDQLAEKGMDPTRIRFVQDASTNEKKARLFAACRSGQVDVLVGSTETMGVGTNVQLRAKALHHVDAPWRPADLEQRDGRVLRQGNENAEVDVLRYVVERSFDAFSWQTLQRKQIFISQVMNGTLDARGADDVSSSQALSFSEVKALATGNPLIMERAQMEADVAKLERLARAHTRDQQHRRSTIKHCEDSVADLSARIPRLRALIESRVDTSGEQFRAVVISPAGEQESCVDRVSTVEAIAAQVAAAAPQLVGRPVGRPIEVCDVVVGRTTFGLRVSNDYLGTQSVLAAPVELPDTGVQVDVRDVTSHRIGLISRMENFVSGLDARLAQAEHARADAAQQASEAKQDLDAPFPREADLVTARERMAAIDVQLAGMAGDAVASPDDPEPEERRPIEGDAAASLAQARAELREKRAQRLAEAAAERARNLEEIRRNRERMNPASRNPGPQQRL